MRAEQATQEMVVDLTSPPPVVADPGRVLGLVRAHWQLENFVRWRLDVVLREDSCQVTAN